MENPFKLIYKFNREAGLLEKKYDDILESSFIIEEALEGITIPEVKAGGLYSLAKALNSHFDYEEPIEATAKSVSRGIVRGAFCKDASNIDRLDKHLDAIVYSVGSIYKLGLSPQQLEQALNIVMQANMKKLGAPKDAEGKQLKPEGWEQFAPEPKLQALLDKR